MSEQMSTSQARWEKWGGALGTMPEFHLAPEQTAFVIVDMQYGDAHRDYGFGAKVKSLGIEHMQEYYFSRVEKLVIPNIQKMQRVCRQRGIEVVFLRVGSLVKDFRDLNAMIRREQILCATVGSKETDILEEIKPLGNELVITKGCSGVFNGTGFDQIITNMGIRNLIFAGVGTNYCVETAVRDAGDRDFNVIMLSDGCAARNAEHERLAAEILDGVYCRVMTTGEVIRILEARAPLEAHKASSEYTKR